MDPAEFLRQEKFAECLSKVETELRFATTAAPKFSLNIIGSQAALKLNDLDKACMMAEMALKLDDTKMNAWQAMADAWRAKNDPRLGEALTKQMAIARKNQKLDRALAFAKDAAVSYEAALKLGEALARWRDVEEMSSELGTIDIDSLKEQCRIMEKMGETFKTEPILWKLLDLTKDMTVAVRLLSRPCHVIVEGRRTQMAEESDVNGAWSELLNRLSRVENVLGKHTAFSIAIRLVAEDFANESIELDTFSEEQITCAKSVLTDPEAPEAIKACFWFLMARKALADGDPLAALEANHRAEQLEQSVYAKTTSVSAQPSQVEKMVAIGPSSAINTRPFTGVELYSLLCGRTAQTHLVAGRAALLGLVDGVSTSCRTAQRHSRDGLSWMTKALVNTLPLRAALDELGKDAEWISTLCNCSRGPFIEDASTNVQDEIATIFQRLQTESNLASLTETLAALKLNPTASWYDRRKAALGELVATVLGCERHPQSPPPLLSSVWEPSFIPSKVVRNLLGDVSLSESKTAVNLFELWRQRFGFTQLNRKVPGARFDPDALQKIGDMDAFPLAFELLGRFFMGYNCPIEHIPDEQPGPKQVRDPATAVKCLQKAVSLDLLGIGAAGPLANAFHAAKKEPQAALLYQSILDHLASSADVHSSNRVVASWTWARLAHQQLHHGKYPNAAASFQRALSALTRADQSRDVSSWTGLGESHMRMGRLGAAAQAFEKAIGILNEELNNGSSTESVDSENLRCASLIKLGTVRTKLGQPAKATEQLRKVLKSATCDSVLRDIAEIDLAESLLEQGRFLNVRGARSEAQERFRESRALFESYLTKNQMSSQGMKGLGDVCVELNDSSKATAAYLHTCFLEPWESLARYDLGRHLLLSSVASKLTRDDGVIKACEAAVVLNPLDALSWNLLGQARGGNKSDTLVEQHRLVRSLQLEPQTQSLTWLNLGCVLLEANRIGLARRAFSQAQTIEADSAAAWLGHASIARKEKNKLNQIPALECAVDAAQYGADTCALQAMLLLGWAICDESSSALAFTPRHTKKKREMALTLLDVASRAIQLASNTAYEAEGWCMTGIALVGLGVPLQAVPAFEKSAELFLASNMIGNADRVLVNLASLVDDPNVGVNLCRMAAQRTPRVADTYEYHSVLGELLLKCGEVDNAIRELSKALDLSSVSPEPSKNQSLMKNHLRVRTVHALTRLKTDDERAMELAGQVCDDCIALLPESIPILQDLVSIGPAYRYLAQQKALTYPPLSLVNEADDPLAIAIADIFCDNPIQVVLVFPWMKETWTRLISSGVSTTTIQATKAALATLKLCERDLPPRVETVFDAGKVVLKSPSVVDGLDQGEMAIEGVSPYWSCSKALELKLKHLCPWG